MFFLKFSLSYIIISFIIINHYCVKVKSKEPLCEQTQHKKVLDKGKPENLMLGIKGSKVSQSNLITDIFDKRKAKFKSDEIA